MINIVYQMKFDVSDDMIKFDIRSYDYTIRIFHDEIFVDYQNFKFNSFALFYDDQKRIKTYLRVNDNRTIWIYIKNKSFESSVLINDELYEICFETPSYELLNILHLNHTYNAINIISFDNYNQVNTIYRKNHYGFYIYKGIFKNNIIDDIIECNYLAECINYKGV